MRYEDEEAFGYNQIYYVTLCTVISIKQNVVH
jgi:hypothetical protein